MEVLLANTITVKEEGYTSNMTQTYYQKGDKSHNLEARHFIGMVLTYVKSNIDQYMLVAKLCMALKKVCRADAWQTYFVKLNLYPHPCVSFEE